jgi:3-hydroxyisobutyrate dehydrogenase-like beta-hydroxyacid dehydrogenase
MAEQVGIIGLGIMGSSYARNLSKGGFEIIGCDVDDAKFAALSDARLTRAVSPAEVAAKVDPDLALAPGATAETEIARPATSTPPATESWRQ